MSGQRGRESIYPEKDERFRSRQITAGPGRAPQRAMFRAMGYDDGDLSSPLTGVANPAADLTPCNVHLDDVAGAAVGGPIAAVREGDTITIDVPGRELAVDLPEGELRARLDAREPEASDYGGVLARYGDDFGSAAEGAVTNPRLVRE